jgi:hypothetical protein
MGIWGNRRARAEAELRARHPGEPWMWEPGWAEKRIPDASRASAIGFSMFAIFWNAIAFPIAFFAWPEMQSGNRGALVALLFPLVGIGLLVVAIRAIVRRMRFRESLFVLDTLPARPGSVLRGTVEIPVERATFAGATSITITLSCIRRVVTGSGKSRSVSESALWQEVVDVTPASTGMAPGGSALPVSIALPPDVPSTETRSANDRTLWRLAVEADMPGIDYASTFELPVFATGEPVAVDVRPIARPAASRPPALRSVVERETVDGLVLEFPRFRRNSSAAALFLFGLIFGGSAYFMVSAGAPFFFPLIFGLVGALILYAAVEQLFASATIVVRRDGVSATQKLLAARTRDYATTAIRDVRMKIGAQQTRTGGTPTPWYELELLDTTGKPRRIGLPIRNKREAEWLLTRIHDRLGRPV